MKFLSLGGVTGPVLFVVVLFFCGSLRPDYSHATQFISELGATGTENAALMNFAGFLPSGLLIAAFGVSLAQVLPRRRPSAVASAFVSFFGVGLVVAGLQPCEPGCPQETPTLHDGVSIAAFLLAIAGSALSAHIFRSSSGWRGIGEVNRNRLHQFRGYLRSRPKDSLEQLLVSDRRIQGRSEDKRFQGRPALLNAYAEAWCLTYYLLKYKPKEFIQYMKMLGAKSPLIENTPDERRAEFEEYFGSLPSVDADLIKRLGRLR